ncbi:MAG: Uma2 family endonuclease [Acidobacteriota bacterium]|jgi:Uma2 family endonuclease|nr:Uma2 family endonuclease [Acidobacteriota bacterium]
MTGLPKHKYNLQEYFEIERDSEEKFEFWDGNIWSMAGASPPHERIVVNVGGHLRELFRGRGCSVFGSNLKVKVPIYPPYRYPDLSVYCGEGIYETMDGLEVLTNPQMLIEVLSPSTEAFDRGDKFRYYKSIPSFTEYLLVAANRPVITQYIKQNETEWIQREAIGLDGKLILQTFEIEILLSEVYLDVEFSEPPLKLFLVDR